MTELGIKCPLVYLQVSPLFHYFLAFLTFYILWSLIELNIPNLLLVRLLNPCVATTLQEIMAPGIPASEHASQYKQLCTEK